MGLHNRRDREPRIKRFKLVAMRSAQAPRPLSERQELPFFYVAMTTRSASLMLLAQTFLDASDAYRRLKNMFRHANQHKETKQLRSAT